MRHSSFRALSILFTFGLFACSSAPASQGDAGKAGDSQASAPQPAQVSIEASCPSTTSCGGAVEGTWSYTGGCAELDLSGLTSACPGASITNTSATVTAQVAFAGGNVSRAYTVTGKATLDVPASCSVPAGGCAAVQSDMAAGTTTASCADDGSSGCKCDVTTTLSDEGSTTYTVQGDTIVTGDGNEYAFCVQGNGMNYRHTNGSSPEQGSFTLSKE